MKVPERVLPTARAAGRYGHSACTDVDIGDFVPRRVMRMVSMHARHTSDSRHSPGHPPASCLRCGTVGRSGGVVLPACWGGLSMDGPAGQSPRERVALCITCELSEFLVRTEPWRRGGRNYAHSWPRQMSVCRGSTCHCRNRPSSSRLAQGKCAASHSCRRCIAPSHAQSKLSPRWRMCCSSSS